MNYSYPFTKAWELLWKYKQLWVLGLFTGAYSVQLPSNDFESKISNFDDFGAFDWKQFESMTEFVPWIVGLVGLIIGALIIFWIVGCFAKPGLACAYIREKEGLEVSLTQAIHDGIKSALKIFLFSIVLDIFYLLLILLLVPPIMLIFTQDGLGQFFAILLSLFVLGIITTLFIIFSIIQKLTERFIAIDQLSVGDSFRKARLLLWRRLHYITIYILLICLASIGISIIIGIPLGIFAAITGLSFASGITGLGFVNAAGLVLVSLFITALINTYFSYCWTAVWDELKEIEHEPIRN